MPVLSGPEAQNRVFGFHRNLARRTGKHRMHTTEIEILGRPAAFTDCGAHQQCGLQRAMHHKAGVFLNLLGIGKVVVNPVRVEGDCGIPEKQCFGCVDFLDRGSGQRLFLRR